MLRLVPDDREEPHGPARLLGAGRPRPGACGSSRSCSGTADDATRPWSEYRTHAARGRPPPGPPLGVLRDRRRPRPARARSALDRLPSDDPGRPRLAALTAWREGRLRRRRRRSLDAPSRARRIQRRRRQRMAAADARRARDPPTRLAARDDARRSRSPAPTRRPACRDELAALAHRRLRGPHPRHRPSRSGDAGLDPHVVTRLGLPGPAGRLDRGPGRRPRRRSPTTGCSLSAWRTSRGRPPRSPPRGSPLPWWRSFVRRCCMRRASTSTRQVALALRDAIGIPVVYEVRGFLEETWVSRHGDSVASSDRYGSPCARDRCMAGRPRRHSR